MDSYFLLFKSGPLVRFFIECCGFENRKIVKEYALAHFPLDWKEVLAPEEFALIMSEHPFPLGTVEYSTDLMIRCM